MSTIDVCCAQIICYNGQVNQHCSGEAHMTTFGEKIQTLLHLKGWNWSLLSQKTGLSKSYLSQIKNGQAGVSDAVRDKIADALDVPSYVMSLDGIDVGHYEDIVQIMDALKGLDSADLQVVLQMAEALQRKQDQG